MRKGPIFLIAGRTGGPLLPLLAISENLSGVPKIIIGIKGGFETKVARDSKTEIFYLPEAKLRLLTFRQQDFIDWVKACIETLWHIILLCYSFVISCSFMIKYQPVMILSTGSFLAVPMLWACYVTNFLGLTHTKIVAHQQDPLPGLASRLTFHLAHVQTCVFDYTRRHFKKFSRAMLIPNPINTKQFDEASIDELQTRNLALFTFLKLKSSKPLILIFGGGSGSFVINSWVIDNLKKLQTAFRILHLTGEIQKSTDGFFAPPNSSEYISFPSLFTDMAIALRSADLVLCRSGLSSITELLYLQKPAFLVPLEHSHQELNAELVSEYFPTLEQKNRNEWLHKILTSYPQDFHKISYPNPHMTQQKLQEYYHSLSILLDN